jgi:hypothetical protein
MIYDVCAVIWKEWREFLNQPGAIRGRGGYQLDLCLVLLVGINLDALPSEWVVAAFVAPTLMITYLQRGPSSFAGERDQHTLPPLLATRVHGEAIFLGKGVFFVLHGVCAGLATVAVGALLLLWRRGVSPTIDLAREAAPNIAMFGILAIALLVQLSLLVSMRSRTANQAQQRSGLVLAGLMLTPIVLGVLLVASMKAAKGIPWEEAVVRLLEELSLVRLGTWMAFLIAVLSVSNTIALLAGWAWSGRARLTLDYD